MDICAVQLRPAAGDIAGNTAKHLRLIDLAAGEGADLILFPELSLTGYEPRLAKSLATDETDPRLDVFQQRSDAHDVIIGVGLPLSSGSHAQIGMVWFSPGKPRLHYAKQRLHADELPFFVQGDRQLVLHAADDTLAPVICYESFQASHAEDAAKLAPTFTLRAWPNQPGPWLRPYSITPLSPANTTCTWSWPTAQDRATIS